MVLGDWTIKFYPEKPLLNLFSVSMATENSSYFGSGLHQIILFFDSADLSNFVTNKFDPTSEVFGNGNVTTK